LAENVLTPGRLSKAAHYYPCSGQIPRRSETGYLGDESPHWVSTYNDDEGTWSTVEVDEISLEFTNEGNRYTVGVDGTVSATDCVQTGTPRIDNGTI